MQTTSIVQEYVVSLGPLWSLLYPSQKYACINHSCNLKLLEMVAFPIHPTTEIVTSMTMLIGVGITS